MKAWIIGCGLIGSSIGLKLRKNNFEVYGSDICRDRLLEAVEKGFIDGIKEDDEADFVFVATPVHSIEDQIRYALSRVKSSCVVSDVAGVKLPIVSSIEDSRYIGGHPMAGSELEGLKGVRDNLFDSCTWVLTPSIHSDPVRYAKLHSLLTDVFKANVLAMPADAHDYLVAVVSHVPHLLAASLLNLAFRIDLEDKSVKSLMAGGFRDMTRVAAGNHLIWPEIFYQNQSAINDVIEKLINQLLEFKEMIRVRNTEEIIKFLKQAQNLRRSLPIGIKPSDKLSEIRVAIQDRPGALAEVLEIARKENINIFDVEIAHLAGQDSGLLLLIVNLTEEAKFLENLDKNGFKATSREIS